MRRSDALLPKGAPDGWLGELSFPLCFVSGQTSWHLSKAVVMMLHRLRRKSHEGRMGWLTGIRQRLAAFAIVVLPEVDLGGGGACCTGGENRSGHCQSLVESA